MTNPALLLHTILSDWINPEDKAIYLHRNLGVGPGRDAAFAEHRLAMRHLSNLEEIIGTMKAGGEDVEHLERALQKWTMWILAYPHDWEQKPKEKSSSITDRGPLDVLKQFGRELARFQPRYGEVTRQHYSEAITAAEEALAEDGSLPPQMRQYLRDVLTHARTVLSDYAIRGDFDLQVALERLMLAVQLARETSQEPKRWESVKEKLVWPTISGLAVAAATPAFGALVQITGQG